MNSPGFVFDNLKLYDTIKTKNPDETYTVIATINEYKTGKLLALATGTQACLRNYADDIEDCHAEPLVKRAYKRYLINKVVRIISNSPKGCPPVDIISEECSQDLTLFVSQFPCGFVKRYEGEEPIDDVTGATIKRKPGRGTVKDGKTVYVEKDNCTVKLQKWIVEGLQGKRLKQMLKIHGKIRKIIIGDCEPDERFDYRSQLERFKQLLAPSTSIRIDLVNNVRRNEFIFSNGRQPQSVAFIWWSEPAFRPTDSAKRPRLNDSEDCEFVVDGRKRGITKDQCLSDNQSFKLRIADLRLREDLAHIGNLLREQNSPREKA